MAFFGKAFSFDGKSSEEFSLMMYDVGGADGSDTVYASTVEIVEDALPRRWRPLFYGVSRGNKLSFTITFGVNQRRLDAEKYLDRYEMQEIGAWLTGHEDYRILEIDQEDMHEVRYKCIISELTVTTYGDIPWALQATVTCDSPYAYLKPVEDEFEIDGSMLVEVNNPSSHSGWFMPVIEFNIEDGDGFSIENTSDGSRTLTFEDLPGAVHRVTVDNDRCIITNDQDLNIYDCCNLQWLRLRRGSNLLVINGTGTFRLKCEFPVNVGG